MLQKLKDYIMYRRVKKLADETLVDMGKLVDMPMKRFKQYVKHKKLNAGQTKLLIDQFETVYENIAERKDALVKQASEMKEGKKRDDIIDTINRIYIVMERLEQRIVWLKDRYSHILGAI